MPYPKLALWKCVEGIAYMFFTMLLILYPQLMDPLNYTDVQFQESDYKLCQCLCSGIFCIGSIFLWHGVSPLVNKYVRPLIVKDASISTCPDSPLYFSIVTAIGRIIIVPVYVLIVSLAIKGDNTILRIIGAICVVVDLVFSIITLCLIRKYGEENVEEKVTEMIQNK